ncbi:hypothetical protein C479_09900 [Halovivax asiaticus JCM 14624]|uniref:Uncharacterized protein n=1 Tax=Halovivax asiaticus JCM 14624 TaxID=1227490 RepID=M0BGT6_9EURY|nr:hypothetical protein C479_09900 [Halovivax asiaticus JCM 14624]
MSGSEKARLYANEVSESRGKMSGITAIRTKGFTASERSERAGRRLTQRRREATSAGKEECF